MGFGMISRDYSVHILVLKIVELMRIQCICCNRKSTHRAVNPILNKLTLIGRRRMLC